MKEFKETKKKLKFILQKYVFKIFQSIRIFQPIQKIIDKEKKTHIDIVMQWSSINDVIHNFTVF
jgi:hypothetical protein